MVAATGPASIGEDQNLLAPIHECLGLGDVGAGLSRLQLLASIAPDDQSAASAGHFGDLIDPEPLNDRVERGRNWRQRAELFDHPIAGGEREPWASLLHALAEHEHVTCKLSGLTTEASWRSWMLDDLQPSVDVVLGSFGPDRVMAGTDWPVCLLAGSYQDVEGLVRDHFRGLSPTDMEGFWGGNCARFYLD